MKKPLLAIEFDDYILKIVRARNSPKGWFVDAFGVEGVSGKSEEDIGKIIKGTLNRLKIKKTQTTLVIPRSVVTVRYLNLPATNPDELSSMVDMQVVRQIPYTREEMVYDYNFIGFTEEGYARILLVIAHRDIIAKYLRIMEKAGIIPDSIELNSMAIMGLCRYLDNEKVKLFSDAKMAVLIDIDYTATNILVIQKGNIIFTRAVSIGAMHVSGKGVESSEKDWITEWVGEVNRSLSAIQREQAVSMDKAVILGVHSDKFMQAITGKLNFPLTVFDLNPYIEGALLQEVRLGGEETNVSIVDLLGAVKEGSTTSVNLLPINIKDSRIAMEGRRAIIITVLLLAGIMGILGLTLNKKMQDRRKYLSNLERRLSETDPLAKELGVKKDRLQIIKKQLSTSGTSLDLLRELYGIIPQKTALNVFIYDDAQGITIKGTSPTMSEVFDLIPKLENSTYFEDVKSRGATQRKVKGQELTDFHIDCSIPTVREGK